MLWSIKNANKYFEQQMLEMYNEFTSEEGIKLYKSNAHFVKDTWRYLKEGKVKYALDYRIILHDYRDYWADSNNSLSERQTDKINDMIVIAKNLNFSMDKQNFDRFNGIKLGTKTNLYFHVPKGRKLKVGQKTSLGKIDAVYEIAEEFRKTQGLYQYEIEGQLWHESLVTTDEDIFTTVKGWKNGNVHYQMNQNFIKKLNLEVGRLRGWIKSPAEAVQELDITEEEALSYWNSSYKLLPSAMASLLPPPPKESTEEQVSVIDEDIEKYGGLFG